MKTLPLITLLLISTLCAQAASKSDTKYKSRSPVAEKADKWFIQSFEQKGLKTSYLVDQQTRSCFLIDRSWNNMSKIDCKSLILRCEWEPVIYWEKSPLKGKCE